MRLPRYWRQHIGGAPESGLFTPRPCRSRQQKDLIIPTKRAFMTEVEGSEKGVTQIMKKRCGLPAIGICQG